MADQTKFDVIVDEFLEEEAKNNPEGDIDAGMEDVSQIARQALAAIEEDEKKQVARQAFEAIEEEQQKSASIAAEPDSTTTASHVGEESKQEEE